MTEEQFIPYSEALALKQLCFNEPCFSYYKNGEFSDILELVKNSEMEDNNSITEYIAAPLYQQAFSFFREKYGLYCYISPFIANEGERRIVYDIFILEDKEDEFDWDDDPYSTYEEAELACLRKLIEIVND